jgi:hypothetical protein
LGYKISFLSTRVTLNLLSTKLWKNIVSNEIRLLNRYLIPNSYDLNFSGLRFPFGTNRYVTLLEAVPIAMEFVDK